MTRFAKKSQLLLNWENLSIEGRKLKQAFKVYQDKIPQLRGVIAED